MKLFFGSLKTLLGMGGKSEEQTFAEMNNEFINHVKQQQQVLNKLQKQAIMNSQSIKVSLEDWLKTQQTREFKNKLNNEFQSDLKKILDE